MKVTGKTIRLGNLGNLGKLGKLGTASGLFMVGALIPLSVAAQVASKGIAPASNTFRSFQDASIARDSGLNLPLDLLNDFYPAIEVTIADSDNVRRRPDLDEPDQVITAAPSLAYRTNIGRHKFYAGYTGRFTFHQDIEQEDAESHVVNASLGLDIARSWDLDLFAGYGDSFERRGISGTLPFDSIQVGGFSNGPNEVEFRNYGADLIYGRKLEKWQAVLGYEYYETDFTNNGQGDDNPLGNRSRSATSVHFDLNYRIGNKLSVFGRIEKTDIDFDRSLDTLDSDQTDFLLGLRWKPSNALSGVVAIGHSDRDFDLEGRSSFDGEIYYANLSYNINPFSVIDFAASRAVEEAGDNLSDFFVSDLIGVSWTHSITPQLVFNAFAKRIEDDFSTDREDRFFDFGLALDYAWKSYLTVGIFYNDIERRSTLDNIEFDQVSYGIRLRSDLRSLLGSSRRERGPEPSSFPADRVNETSRRSSKSTSSTQSTQSLVNSSDFGL